MKMRATAGWIDRAMLIARWGLCVLICGLPATGSSQELRIGSLALPDRPELADEVLQGRHDGSFRPEANGDLRLGGDTDRIDWLRIAFDLPAVDDPHEQMLALRFDRVGLKRLTVWLPEPDGRRVERSDGFFAPQGGRSLALNAFAFELSHHLRGPQVVYVAVQSEAVMPVTPRLEPLADLHDQDRTLSSLLSAVYACIGVLILSAFSLFLALRDRAYLHFCGLNSGLLLLLLAINGHLYHLDLLAWMAWWRNNGIYALALLCCALALGFTRAFLELERDDPRADRGLLWLRRGLFTLAALVALNFSGLATMLQMLAAAVGTATAAIVLVISIRAWHRGEALARSYSLVWMILLAAIATRAALSRGWLPQNLFSLYGFQIATAFCLFLMSIGLADRVMEFRKQRDRAHRLKVQTDVSLQFEQVRRQFTDGLRELARQGGDAGDLDWMVFHRLLTSLRQVLPQRGAVVWAPAFHGRELLVVEPVAERNRYEALLDAQELPIRRVCAERQANVLSLARPATDTLEAQGDAAAAQLLVVPMTMEAPSWGVLLIEREPGAEFSLEEVGLVRDFLRQAIAAADEARQRMDLKRKAEIDPLTGACNRRSGEGQLEAALRASIAEHKPFSLLFVDLDHFKQVNDVHGHAVGDDCLRRAAETIRHEIRADDVLLRYGGEEFLVVLPGLTPDLAAQLGERIRHAVMALRLPGDGDEVQFTVSIGVAGRLPGEERAQAIIERADKALYAAKRNGRNQVRSAPSGGYGSEDALLEPSSDELH